VAKLLEAMEHKEVHLDGVLAEFRTALKEEIEAARRNAAGTSVTLINGRRIAKIGSSYQYLFTIENVLNLPADTPGDLYITGRARVSVTVISIDGLAITVSVSEDLGSFVPSASLHSDLAFLMRRLIERIENLAESSNPAGDRLLGNVTVSGEPVHVEPGDLNSRQVEAVASSLGRDTTFIWGPPGTGKTKTIGSISKQLYHRDRSALLVSHTNTAVDQALLHVGEALTPEELAQGRVLRVGEPRDPRLLDYPDLLLDTHVKRRSAQLAQRRDALESERDKIATEVLRISRSIELCEWVSEAQRDITSMRRSLEKVQQLENDLEQAKTDYAQLAPREEYWAKASEDAGKAQIHLSRLRELNEKKSELVLEVSRLRIESGRAAKLVAEADDLLKRAEAIAPLRGRARKLPSCEKQAATVREVSTQAAEARVSYEIILRQLNKAEAHLRAIVAMSGLRRIWRRLPSPTEQLSIVKNLQEKTELSSAELDRAEQAFLNNKSLLVEVSKLADQLRPHADVPELSVQQRVVQKRRKEEVLIQNRLRETDKLLAQCEIEQKELNLKVRDFGRDYPSDPEHIVRRAENFKESLREAVARRDRLYRQVGRARTALEDILEVRLGALREWNLTSEKAGPAEQMLDAIRAAYVSAAEEARGLDASELRGDRDQINHRIRFIDDEIHQIDEALKRVEEALITEASIVATTLTRAYLRDTIQSRRFDTVILDEASMAPIPALWVAASLADANTVVVGDFKQLPPIVLSDHDLAKQWLGRDIFEVAGMTATNNHLPHLIKLRRQYRMHPKISAIPNTLVYQGDLEDDQCTLDEGALNSWYRHDWGYDHPVLLVDTGSLGAWVTSVPRGRSSSRLNFLSATVCVDLAEQLLRIGRDELPPGGPPRILIVSPYRPHAKLLELMLQEQEWTNDVRAGTAHSFQGSEADAVILDLVNDEPHWRVGMFDPRRDQNTIRLLNVALTRARHRLVIVGDFDYIAQQAKNAFLGRELIPFLKDSYPCVEAARVVPAGLAARAASAQVAVLGGQVEPDAARIVVTQVNFYSILNGDLARTRRRVVFFSPFITQNRLAQLEAQIRAAIERDVQVFVVTKTHADRGKRELSRYRILERALTDWGVTIIHKQRMHEKLVFIDDDVLWIGSLNPLSFSNTQEVMERRSSRKVVEDYAKTLRLDELVGEYEAGSPKCPICGSEVVATEGRDEPYYWRCVMDGCFTRSIDQTPPRNGLIPCANCGGAVEFGEWGGKPAWRCRENRHHHQRVHLNHLRLPKMRKLVPSNALRELEKRSAKLRSMNSQGQNQMPLFEN